MTITLVIVVVDGDSHVRSADSWRGNSVARTAVEVGPPPPDDVDDDAGDEGTGVVVAELSALIVLCGSIGAASRVCSSADVAAGV